MGLPELIMRLAGRHQTTMIHRAAQLTCRCRYIDICFRRIYRSCLDTESAFHLKTTNNMYKILLVNMSIDAISRVRIYQMHGLCRLIRKENRRTTISSGSKSTMLEAAPYYPDLIYVPVRFDEEFLGNYDSFEFHVHFKLPPPRNSASFGLKWGNGAVI